MSKIILLKPEISQKLQLSIERLGIHAEGVGYYQGYTIFVDHALPGEEVIVELYECRKSFGRAKIIEILKISPDRIAPPCPLFAKCGGCQSMHLKYSEQLKRKRQTVVDALERIGKFFNVNVLPCFPAPFPLGYRNKIQLPVTPSGKMGLYAWNSHNIIEIEKCYIHSSLGEKALESIRNILQSFPQLTKNLNHVLIKTAIFTKQILVILVTEKEKIIDLPLLAKKILDSKIEIKGVVQNINSSKGNVILGKKFQLLEGKPYIEEEICNLSFKVSPSSFFQVNPFQAENLYKETVKLCALSGKETLLDAYCGVGTLGLILAKHAKKVFGVECISQTVQDAKENARRNQIFNAEFICASIENVLDKIKAIDVAVLNPPRKGCDLSFLQKLICLKPKRVIYISCNPATLARDLAFLHEGGYTIDHIQPFDMFPQTAHVETLVRLIID